MTNLFTAPQTIPGQLSMPGSDPYADAATADAHVGEARTLGTAMDRLEAALAAGIPIGDMLAEQRARHARGGFAA